MRAGGYWLLAAALAGAACSRTPPTTAPTVPPVAVAAYGYDDERRAAEQAVAAAKAAIARGPVVWPQWKTLAEAQLVQAQLTGDYTGYKAAAESLAQAFALASGGGPFFARAKYNFTLHRLGLVEADLKRAEKENDPDRTAILGLRADVAFYRGHYDQALAGYRAAIERSEDVSGLVRLAVCHARMGHASEAHALIDRAEAIYHGDSPHPRAWLALQHGLIELDRGRYDTALAHYHHALRELPGWWLAREHIAEIHALQGDAETALREYGEIVEETNSPEFMDAMAKLLGERGDHAAAQNWISRARQLYDARLATLPEATYGHGLDHFLLFGTPEEALELARKNHALRPNGESAIKLAHALLRAGKVSEAVPLMRAALLSGWNTAELHMAAAQVFAAAGLAAESAEQAARAMQMNPHAAKQYSSGGALSQPVGERR